jgi:predicted transcriptional regulator
MGKVRLADELVTKAHQTRTRLSFIEDSALLEPFGGVAVTLRYRPYIFLDRATITADAIVPMTAIAMKTPTTT